MDIAQRMSVLEVGNLYQTVLACNAALFVYEYLLTLADEAKFIWPSGLGVATILYYTSRYTIIPEICAQMIFLLGNPSDFQCRFVTGYTSFSTGTGVMLGQGIIVLRTWAIWNGSRVLIWCLSLVAVIFVGIHFYLGANFIARAEVVASSTIHPRARGCSVLSSHNVLYVGWTLLCTYDIVLVGMTSIKYIQERAATSFLGGSLPGRRGRARLTIALYRDAFSYFAIMLVFALANLTATLLVPAAYRMLFYGTERIIYTCLACRIIMGLRAAAEAPISISTVDPDSTDDAHRDEERGTGTMA